MKKMTLDKFESFLSDISKWSSETTVYPEGHSFTAHGTRDGKEHETSWGYISTVNRRGTVTLTWTESYSYFCYEPSSLEYGDNGGEYSLSLEGVTVVDEDGDEISTSELERIIGNDHEWFTLHDGEKIIELDDFDDYEHVGTGAERETVRRDYRPDIVVHYDAYAGATTRNPGSRKWEEVDFYGWEDGPEDCICVAWAAHSIWDKVPSLYDGEVFTGKDCREKAVEWLEERAGEELIDLALMVLEEL